VSVTYSELQFHTNAQFVRVIGNVGGAASESERCSGKECYHKSEVRCSSHNLKLLIVCMADRERDEGQGFHFRTNLVGSVSGSYDGSICLHT
jgi:hypothetical protein